MLERSSTEIGARILRAPPTAEETASFLAFWTASGAENPSFEEAAGLLIEAMLQAPRFIYRLEAARALELVREADGHEMASRLSYLSGAPHRTTSYWMRRRPIGCEPTRRLKPKSAACWPTPAHATPSTVS